MNRYTRNLIAYAAAAVIVGVSSSVLVAMIAICHGVTPYTATTLSPLVAIVVTQTCLYLHTDK